MQSPQEIDEEDDDIFVDNQTENDDVASYNQSDFNNDIAELPETEMETEQFTSAPEPEHYDEFALFGMYIAEKLRKMDRRSQITLQHKISGLLFDAEMQAVNDTITQFKSEPQD